MSAKYLSDGRKVVVIGQLNNIESIVQGIFVTASGDEIPSGERFVVKSLHDAPVESYKAKEEKRLDVQLTKLKSEIESLERKKRDIGVDVEFQTKLLAKSKYILQAFGEDLAERVSNFMTGKIKYLVRLGYGIEAPVPMESEIMEKSDYGRFEGTRLVSIHGKKDDLQYRINRWSDGSGGDKDVYPCLTYEEAISKIKEYAEGQIEKNYLSKDSYDKCLSLGIVFSDEAIEKYKAFRIAQVKTSIESQKTALEKAESVIDSLNHEWKELESK
jgi:hypothetical protein